MKKSFSIDENIVYANKGGTLQKVSIFSIEKAKNIQPIDATRSFEERLDEEKVLADQIWILRHKFLAPYVKRGIISIDPELWEQSEKELEAMEDIYGEMNEDLSPFELGRVYGELAALRWARGCDTDDLIV